MSETRSKKPAVIEKIFVDRWDPESNSLTETVVTMSDIGDAIRTLDVELSTDNLANFFKDIVRNGRRNANFPASVVAAGYTAQQAAGKGDKGVFEFIPLPPGATQAFPEHEPAAEKLENPLLVQSLCLPMEARKLGREDESWLAQAVAELRLIETHLALHSDLDLIGVAHLMTNMKLGSGEIDSMWRGEIEHPSGETESILIPAEMKSRNEVLELEQVRRGAMAAAAEAERKLSRAEAVLPMAVKVLSDHLVWVLEFEMDFSEELRIASDAVYRPSPEIPGV
jgi:hypothetical protein